MPRAITIPADLLDRLGKPDGTLGECRLWRFESIAGAAGCSPQTLVYWCRIGKLPAPYQWRGKLWFAESTLADIAARGVRPQGTYTRTPGRYAPLDLDDWDARNPGRATLAGMPMPEAPPVPEREPKGGPK